MNARKDVRKHVVILVGLGVEGGGGGGGEEEEGEAVEIITFMEYSSFHSFKVYI